MRTSPTAFLALGALTALSLTACGGGGGGGNDGDDFTYWSMWRQEEPQAKVIKAAVDKFQTETGAKVKIEWQGRDIRQKVAPAIAAGQAPDLWDQGADIVFATAAQSGQADDLSDVYDSQIPGEGKKVADVIPTKYVDTLPKDPSGKNRWLVPYELVSAQLFYNAADPDLAEPPATWDEFIGLCEKLKKKNKACLASDGDLGWENALLLDYLLVRDNGPGTFAKLATDKTGAAWDSPGALESVKRIEQFVKGGYLIKGYDASKNPAQQVNWAKGKAAFYLNGSWVASETKPNQAPGFKFSAINVPPTKGGNTHADVILFGFSIPKKAKHPEAAKKFISYFLKKDNLTGISTEAANITPRADIPAPPELADVQKILQSNPNRAILDGDTMPPGDYGDKVLSPAFLELWHGKITAEQFIAKLKKDQAAFWKTQS